jgi:hypothetical protein
LLFLGPAFPLWEREAGGPRIKLSKTDSEKGMAMKSIIALTLVVGAVALGACRREEAVVEPMKLGATPAAEQIAR